MSNITINPAQQTNFAGTFFKSSNGFTAGMAQPDPNNRFNLRKGVVAANASAPMWGGLLVSEVLAAGGVASVGATGLNSDLQSVLAPGTTLTQGATTCVTGVTVFDQSTSMIQSAQSRVPLAGPGGAINFYRFGSGARIALPCDSVAAALWKGGVVDPTTFYWDTVNLRLVSAAGANIIGPFDTFQFFMLLDDLDYAGQSRTVSYSSGTGFANWTENGYCAVVRI